MTMPRIFLCLLAVFFSASAHALQLGQISTFSALGENLEARVELYGLSAATAATSRFEIKPDIGPITSPAKRAAIDSIRIEVSTARDGSPYLVLRSTRPINDALVGFRLRARADEGTAIAHYTLALSPQRYINPRADRARVSTTKIQQLPVPGVDTSSPGQPSGNQSYGPVRSGQTLWRILKELGLTNGNTAALIADIVATNPHAFSNADANRLRVGVMLEIPRASVHTQTPALAPVQTRQVSETAPVVNVPATDTANVATTVTGSRTDPATAARLTALSEKFAAIKARYAAQQLASAAAATNTIAAQAVAPAPVVAVMDDGGQTLAADSVPAPHAAAVSVEPAPADLPRTRVAPVPAVREPAAQGLSLRAMILIGVASLLLIGLGIRSSMRMWARRRTRRHHVMINTGDQELVAEVALKAEKRLQLEEEVKRRLSEKREAAVPAAPAIERLAEREVASHDTALTSLDEIENRIAHGQYAEAEAMLNDVIAATPGNYRAKLRLAEIYYLNERADEFVALATELSNHHRADIGDDGWQRVVRMGKVIAPERPPFSGPVSVGNKA